MFVISIKTSKRKILALSGITACILFCIIMYFSSNSSGSICVMSNNNISTKATDNTSRINFISSFGWKTDSEPMEISDIVIPDKFSQTYQNYNAIQKEQGFNLEKYKGRACKQFKYKVLNYPGTQNGVVANLIVYKNKVIGGDISSVELSGFMHGFENPNGAVETATKVDWEPSPGVTKSNNITKTTYKQDLNPSDTCGDAPID